VGLLGEWVKYEEIFKLINLFIYAFFGNSPAVQTYRPIFKLDGSNDADSRKGVPFRGFVNTAPHWRRGKSPKTHSNFWGVNKRFQSKRAKY